MKKTKRILKKSKKKFVEYLSTNRLFLSFVFFSLLSTILLRCFTVGNVLDYKPLLVDLALIVLIGSLGYLVKPKNQFKYFFTCVILINVISFINSVYYTFYLSFASFGLLATVGQVGDVADSLLEKFRLADFVYFLFVFAFYYIHRKLNKTNYYNYVAKVEKGKKMAVGTALFGAIIVAITMVTMDTSDYSRLAKQWNREYIVERFGVILYQGNDLIQSLTPKINSLFGYDEAARTYREFYENLDRQETTNKYTDMLKGKNIVFVHMESIQTFLMSLNFNGESITPNINRLAQEGMYFSNFYPQISTGTSSDTEFTLLTSLMPALSGTVAVSYYNREYISIPKLLKDQGYYIFSMHGNKADMWNRANLHESLGYDEFYSKSSYVVTNENTIGLGISDSAFFEQSIPYLEEIEDAHDNYMGTIITLSNHSPFNNLEKYGELDLSYTGMRLNEKTGEIDEAYDEYLEDTKIGNYIKSAHYADKALGEFINYIMESDHFNNTVFVFYGDHDAKLARSEFNYLYNYDVKEGVMLEEGDSGYKNYDSYAHDLNKNTPLIIWTKEPTLQKKLDVNVEYTMGMYDILPTIGNMMGFKSEYALGHDIFSIKDDNIVIFPNGNFLTSKVLYNNASEEYITLKEGIIIPDDYIEKCKAYTEARLEVSNNIIVHDLIRKEANKANYSEVVK